MKSSSPPSGADRQSTSSDVRETNPPREAVEKLRLEHRRATLDAEDPQRIIESLKRYVHQANKLLEDQETVSVGRLRDRAGSWNSTPFDSLEQLLRWEMVTVKMRNERRSLEKRLIEQAAEEDTGVVEGFCFFCDAPSEFHFRADVEDTVASWREQLYCRRCFLHNRQRAILHFLSREPPLDGDRVYITEQVTILYERMALIYDDLQGSEFLGDRFTPGEIDERGVRHENLTALTFADESFDLIGSFDVLEHIPDYHQALQELTRVLRPGGRLLLTVPFDARASENFVRARVLEDGTIEHLMEPEYHGDPLQDEGCLSFYIFSWQICEELRELGFRDVEWHGYWSRENLYLGADQYFLVAEKEGRPPPRPGLQNRLQGRLAAQRQKLVELQAQVDDLSAQKIASERRSKDVSEIYEAQILQQEAMLQEIQANHEIRLQEIQASHEAERQDAQELQQQMRRDYEAEIERQKLLRLKILEDRKIAEQALTERFAEDLKAAEKRNREAQQAAEQRIAEARGVYEAEIEKLSDVNCGYLEEIEKIPGILAEHRALQETYETMEERYTTEILKQMEVMKKMESDVHYLQGEMLRLQEELQTARKSES